jgi:dTDP-4-amino-4,6-dideoxygalactose transaminase
VSTVIPFNKPYLSGNEIAYIEKAVKGGKISGDGLYTQQCHQFFESRYNFGRCLLTTSCTDALEMCALLLDIQPGDEVIMPSYTFVSTANAFVLRGAKIIFADSRSDHPGMDEASIEALITAKTKAVVVVHYAGVACDMDVVMGLADKYKLWVVEDAAQAIESFYKGRPLGSIGHLAAFSFHETKNIQCGEGGMLVINDERFFKRAEIIREKGTNRSAFFRGETDKYSWVDIGSSFLPSDINAAFLMAQLENLEQVQNRRKQIWQLYYESLEKSGSSGAFKMPYLPAYATNNAHMFYIVCKSANNRQALIKHLKTKGIMPVFHYLSLHKSSYYADKHDGRILALSDRYSDCLVRLPFYYELTDENLMQIVTCIQEISNDFI